MQNAFTLDSYDSNMYGIHKFQIKNRNIWSKKSVYIYCDMRQNILKSKLYQKIWKLWLPYMQWHMQLLIFSY